MNDTAPDTQHSNIKKAVFWAIALGLMLLLFEVLASTVLLYSYRFDQTDSAVLRNEISNFSSINLIYKVARRAEFFEHTKYPKFRVETQPDSFWRPDSELGYSAIPGVHVHTYFHRPNPQSDWRSLKINVTINEDQTRWTGGTEQGAKSSVYIFGDSYVFGHGVNDEHTFAYLFQQARPDLKVRLFALGGYSLTQAYLRFDDLKDSINPSDIIILGYADFYDVRHVVAPSRLREIGDWVAKRDLPENNIKAGPGTEEAWEGYYLPRASLIDGSKISISYIQENCLHNDSYCEGSDPSRIEMTKVTAALINYIADNTLAKVYLLHFLGDADNTVLELTRDNITLISALPSDFDYFIQDDVEGFDPHPGPYWHYAISRKLLQVLSDI